MPETNGQQDGSAVIDPSENLSGWLEARAARDAGAEEQTGQSEQPATPAEPSVAVPDLQNQPAAVDWREFVLPDDVPHGFFKGKKLPEVFESISHAERAKQAAERERNEYRRELEALRAERAAPPQASQPDPRTVIQDKFYEDPRAVAQQIAELARQEARQIYQAERQQESTRQQFQSTQQAHENLAQQIASEYGLAPEVAADVVIGTYPKLNYLLNQEGVADAFTNLDYARQQIRRVLGDPRPAAPAIQAPPVPQLSDPPGSGRPATTQRRAPEPSPLSSEEEAVRRSLAKAYGIDPQVVIDISRRRAGGSRG